MKPPRYCVDCLYSLRVFPDDGPSFFQCGRYFSVSLVDKHQTYFPCERLRKPFDQCGTRGVGFVPSVPDFPTPRISRTRKFINGVKRVWWQRRSGYFWRQQLKKLRRLI